MHFSKSPVTFCVEHVCEIAGEMRETKQATAMRRVREEFEAMAEFEFWCGVVFDKTEGHVNVVFYRAESDSVHLVYDVGIRLSR